MGAPQFSRRWRDGLLKGRGPRRRLLRDTLAFLMGTVVVRARDKQGQTATAEVDYTITNEPPPDGPFIPYTAGAFLKSKAAGAPIDEARTSAMHQFMATFVDQKAYRYPRIKGTGSNLWGTTYAMGTDADPTWLLTGTVPASIANQLKVVGFHAPEWLGSMLTGTSDSPFCVIDRAHGITVFGGKATKGAAAHTINVQSAGCMWHSSNGLDGRNPASSDKRNLTSRGRLSEALVIRRDLVDYAIKNDTDLGMVLHLFIAESGSGHCHPMVGDEGARGGFGVEGERLIIRPDIDLTRRGLSPAGLAVARTLQNYGCYIGDNAGGESALKAEQEKPGHPVWGGILTMDSLRGITWDDFACVRLGWQ